MCWCVLVSQPGTDDRSTSTVSSSTKCFTVNSLQLALLNHLLSQRSNKHSHHYSHSGAVVGVTVPDARCPGFKCMFLLKCSVRIKCTKVKRSINLFVWYPVAQLDELCFWIERLFVQTQARSSRRWCGVGGSDGRMSWKCWRAWPDLTWDEGGNTQASAPPGSGQMNKEGYGTGRESIDLVLHP